MNGVLETSIPLTTALDTTACGGSCPTFKVSGLLNPYYEATINFQVIVETPTTHYMKTSSFNVPVITLGTSPVTILDNTVSLSSIAILEFTTMVDIPSGYVI